MTPAVRCSAVLWDVGGTLLVEAISGAEFVRSILRHLDIAPDDLREEAVARALAQFEATMLRWRTADDEREGFRRLAAGLLDGSAAGRDPVLIERLAKAIADYDVMYVPPPGIRDLLAEIAVRGIRQGVVSNWLPSLPRLLRTHALDRHLEIVVNSAEEGVVKPDPGLLARALDRLGLDASRVVYVGDDPDLDMRPAQHLGVPFIHFDPGGRHPAAHARDTVTLRRLLAERFAGRGHAWAVRTGEAV
jgi:HAD superfamily hydrolase (TIGR01549 family)